MALVASDLKRVLAYSTVSQLGYMVYAVGAGGLFASQFHLLSHSVFKALLFLGAGAVIHAVGTRDMRQMGGLGAKMPVVRFVFIVGALALAGLPVLNGFWSKELVLEEGLKGGPVWMYAVMLIGAGLTACYTFRMVWMVFYGKPRAKLHAHDAGSAMKVALLPLALGTFTTWLLAGPFAHLLEETMPAYGIEAHSTLYVIEEILLAPATLLAMAVIVLGLAAWWQRERLQGLAAALHPVARAAQDSFGFEAINRGVVQVTATAAENLRGTQTGLLSWNIFAILAALVIVLAVLLVGA
jgi:NADH-quinone oxidoreductase subunit L